MSIEPIEPDLDAAGIRVGIVQSRFNPEVGDALRNSCLAELLRLGALEEDILLATVPGALEIPLVLQKMAVSGQFDALIALGAVIRGETFHFELVARESAAGVARLALEFGIPVANAILTTDTVEQAQARMQEKGAEAARVAVEIANLTGLLEPLSYDEDGAEDGDDE